jgi:flavodoxin
MVWLSTLVLVLLSQYAFSPPLKLEAERKKSLIVYLSRTKNTEALARIIQKEVGGKLVALELQQPYPAHYQTTVDQVAEENRTGYLPPLKTKIENFCVYDTLYLGFPTWGMQLPPPIKSFLNQYDLIGKTVIPFNTHGGYGAGNSFQTLAALCKNCRVVEGLSVEGGREKQGKLLVIKNQEALEVEAAVKFWLKNVVNK